MINLLPPDIKEDYLYAHRNTRLRGWIIACGFALGGILLIVSAGLIYMQHSINAHGKEAEQTRLALQTQKISDIQKRVDGISANTKLAVQVLSREILFSKLIKEIGGALPEDAILKSLEINKAQGGIQGGLQLNAAAGSFNSATQIQVNLQDPDNKVFDKADINSVSCGAAPNPSNKYPCEITLRALFGKNNSYFYIAPNQASGAKR